MSNAIETGIFQEDVEVSVLLSTDDQSVVTFSFPDQESQLSFQKYLYNIEEPILIKFFQI